MTATPSKPIVRLSVFFIRLFSQSDTTEKPIHRQIDSLDANHRIKRWNAAASPNWRIPSDTRMYPRAFSIGLDLMSRLRASARIGRRKPPSIVHRPEANSNAKDGAQD